jgi:DNA-binding transcriptional MerR regulator
LLRKTKTSLLAQASVATSCVRLRDYEDKNYKKTFIILVNKKLFVILLRTTFYKTTNMALNINKNLKAYYSIREVAQMIGVSEPTLRYWETEFPFLKPRTTANKVRQYQDKDIENIRLIYGLVKVRGMKIAAARKAINANRAGVEHQTKILERLIDVKSQLMELKGAMDKIV